jgi:hypothetical protein
MGNTAFQQNTARSSSERAAIFENPVALLALIETRYNPDKTCPSPKTRKTESANHAFADSSRV